ESQNRVVWFEKFWRAVGFVQPILNRLTVSPYPVTNEEDLDDNDGEDEEFEDPDEEDEIQREIRDWHQLANRGPRTQPLQHSRLGKRDIDRDYDWHHSHTTFEDLRHKESYLESQKRLADTLEEIPDV